MMEEGILMIFATISIKRTVRTVAMKFGKNVPILQLSSKRYTAEKIDKERDAIAK